jgi:hypothetical protein
METICKRRNKEEARKKRQNERKDLTLTGFLMEGVIPPSKPDSFWLADRQQWDRNRSRARTLRSMN